MPAMNGNVLDIVLDLARTVLTLKIGDETSFNFKDEHITLRRVK